VRAIRKARFEALSYARNPFVKGISEEIEWFSNKNNAVLGVVLMDKTGKDYVAMVLGRDEAGVFRSIDSKVSIKKIDEARKILIEKMESHSKNGAEEFPQKVITRNKNLIFKALVGESVMPEDYKLLIDNDLFSPARELIQEIAYSFEDPDGNYIEQFQSTGFNARLWELYLYALFHELDFSINRKYNAPDYVIEKSGIRVCIEAVTVNTSQNGFDEDEPKTTEDKRKLLADYIPIKYGSPLFSKLKKKYWEKDHVSEHPFVIAIHDYHQKDSMMWTRSGLETYLFGVKRTYKKSNTVVVQGNIEQIEEHRWKGKVIPSNFFSQPDSENISAVIHSNQATIGKFLRMGYLAEFGRRDLDIRVSGKGIVDNDFENIEYDYDYDVTDPFYEEFWSNSVIIFHNPNAKHPLDCRLFEGVAHVFLKDGKFIFIKPKFYPLFSRTRYRVKNN